MGREGVALVTGVTGFVGANLARHLLEKGYEVKGLVRGQSDRRHLPKDRHFQVIEGDLTHASSVIRAAQDCSEIYHVAADYRFWAPHPKELYLNNMLGTRNVMRAAEKVRAHRIVYTSTVGTLGLLRQPELSHEDSESAPNQFNNVYKKSKKAAENVALRYIKRGLPIVIVNPSTPVGPWDSKPTPSGKVVVDFVTGRMPGYAATGLNYIHVRDVAEGHFLAARKGRVGEKYILGSQNLSMEEFLNRIAKRCHQLSIPGAPRKAPFLRVPYPFSYLVGWVNTRYADWISRKPPSVPLDAVRMSKRYMYFDSSKAVRELQLPQTSIDKAIDDALIWFLENGYFRR